MTAVDVAFAVEWQRADGFRLGLAFNGSGSLAAGPAGTDPLTAALVAARHEFGWINRIWSHLYFGCVRGDVLTRRARWNDALAGGQVTGWIDGGVVTVALDAAVGSLAVPLTVRRERASGHRRCRVRRAVRRRVVRVGTRRGLAALHHAFGDRQ
jgi:hypothetical protein